MRFPLFALINALKRGQRPGQLAVYRRSSSFTWIPQPSDTRDVLQHLDHVTLSAHRTAPARATRISRMRTRPALFATCECLYQLGDVLDTPFLPFHFNPAPSTFYILNDAYMLCTSLDKV